MKVILKESVSQLGQRGDVVDVADGYARNYLLPKGLALSATLKNMKLLEREQKIEETHCLQKKEDAEEMVARLQKISLTIRKKAGEQDILFGSVTPGEIVEALKQEGLEIDRKRIIMEQSIKRLGVYSVKIKLYAEVMGEVKVWVVKE
ncbi:50S ribosomal protein L9 [bacterium (candidate division B38) B3_B38]|nr:MAG: 50S ribosomal protein L9 [bacterium (candidate division B38) B3_B38]